MNPCEHKKRITSCHIVSLDVRSSANIPDNPLRKRPSSFIKSVAVATNSSSMPGHQWQEGNNVLSCHCLVWTRTWLFSCNQASQDHRRSTGKGQLNGSQTIQQNRKNYQHCLASSRSSDSAGSTSQYQRIFI